MSATALLRQAAEEIEDESLATEVRAIADQIEHRIRHEDRIEYAVAQRRAGMSYRRIGLAVGRSHEWARYICNLCGVK